VNVSRIATLNLVEDLAVRRVNDVDGFSGRGGDGRVGNVVEMQADYFASNGLQLKRVSAAG